MVEHLQHTAMEQQKAVADSLAVARETLRGYRDISDGWQNRSGMKSEMGAEAGRGRTDR